MEVYVVTHPEAGVVGVFASEGDFEHFMSNEQGLDEDDLTCEWITVYKR